MERDEFILNGLTEDFDTSMNGTESESEAEVGVNGLEGVRQKFVEVGAPIERQQFLNFWKKLPKHIQDGLLNGKFQISGHAIYAEKPISGSTIEMFKASDRFATGKSNLDNGNKLSKDTYQVVSAIKFIYSDVASDAEGYEHKFIPYPILAGDIKFWHRNEGLLRKGFPMSQFASLPGYKTNEAYGQSKMMSPKLLHPDEDIVFDINFTRALTGGFLRVELIGASIL